MSKFFGRNVFASALVLGFMVFGAGQTFAQSRTGFPAGFCPPGLAMKGNGCLPPGLAKKQGAGHEYSRHHEYGRHIEVRPVPSPQVAALVPKDTNTTAKGNVPPPRPRPGPHEPAGSRRQQGWPGQ